MAKETIDRRISRTRAMLQHALNKLTLDKGYEAITIKDICDEANVGRSTFYAHFTSKDDLKRKGLDHLRHELINQQRQARANGGDLAARSLGFSLPMFEHARDHIELYRALVDGRGGAVALGTIREILSDLVRDDLSATRGNSAGVEIPTELVVHYVVGAFMSVMIWWLDGGAKLSPDEIDAMFRQLAMTGAALEIRPVDA